MKYLLLFMAVMPNLYGQDLDNLFPRYLEENTLLASNEVPTKKKTDEEKPKKEYRPATKTIPFWEKELMGEEYQGPLPFGLALNFLYLNQDLAAEEITTKIVDYPKALISLSPVDAMSITYTAVLRPDVWILPFLNIYGVIGGGGGKVKVHIDQLIDFDSGKIVSLDLDLKFAGSLFGIGTMLSGNIKKFFALFDFNFNYSNLNLGDSSIKAFRFSPKIGYLIKKKKSTGGGAVWVGTSYVNLKFNLVGIQGESDDNDVEVFYDLKFGTKKPWNLIFGGAWEFNPRWGALMEIGIGNRKQFSMAGKYRF